MPRVLSFRLVGLWVAFALNDYGSTGYVRLGLTERHARNRSFRAICAGAYGGD
jgi:hypothetical protein